MSLGERILLAFSRDPDAPDYDRSALTDSWNPDDALYMLRRVFPDFDRLIRGKSVVDFGCGEGHQAVAAAVNGAARVLGIDMNPKWLRRGRELAAEHGVADRVEFVTELDEARRGTFAVVISKDSMEHFSRPAEMMTLMTEALEPGGLLLVTFGPPWYSAYGAHMQSFTLLPWVNLLFTERTVMKVRSRYRSDGAQHYEDIEGGLNRMTVAKFEGIVARSGLEVKYRLVEYSKGLTIFSRVPFLREMFAVNVSYILKRR